MFNPFDIIDAAALEEVFGDPFVGDHSEPDHSDYPEDEDNMAHLLPLDRWEDRRVPEDKRDIVETTVCKNGQVTHWTAKRVYN